MRYLVFLAVASFVLFGCSQQSASESAFRPDPVRVDETGHQVDQNGQRIEEPKPTKRFVYQTPPERPKKERYRGF